MTDIPSKTAGRTVFLLMWFHSKKHFFCWDCAIFGWDSLPKNFGNLNLGWIVPKVGDFEWVGFPSKFPRSALVNLGFLRRWQFC